MIYDEWEFGFDEDADQEVFEAMQEDLERERDEWEAELCEEEFGDEDFEFDNEFDDWDTDDIPF